MAGLVHKISASPLDGCRETGGLSARLPRFGTQAQQGRRPTQWVTALSVAANGETSCAPEMESEAREGWTLGLSSWSRLSSVPLSSSLKDRKDDKQ